MANGGEEENAESAEPAEAVEPTEPPPPPDEGAPPAGPPPTRGRWLVPKWAVVALVGLVAVALLFGSAFAIGRATASGGDGRERIERGFEGRPPGGEAPQRPQVSGVFLGVATQSPTGDQQGAEVENVASGSPAAGAGLQQGDVITRSEERRVGKECRSLCDWSSDVCSSDLVDTEPDRRSAGR